MSPPANPGAHRARIAARAGDERHEVEPVAAVERQILHLAAVTRPASSDVLRLDERRFAAHRDRFLHGRELHA